MKLDIYGRFRLEIIREGDRWVAFELDGGKRMRQQELIIPSGLAASEIASYLDDLYHEMSRPGDRITEIA